MTALQRGIHECANITDIRRLMNLYNLHAKAIGHKTLSRKILIGACRYRLKYLRRGGAVS